MTKQMFLCRAAPKIPAADGTDADLASYMVRLVLAREDCEDQLSLVRSHLEINGVLITDDIVLTEIR